jgi:hypothetical protein
LFISPSPLKPRDSPKNPRGLPKKSPGTPRGVLIFGDSPGRIKVIPWGFTREFAFFKGFPGDFVRENGLGESKLINEYFQEKIFVFVMKKKIFVKRLKKKRRSYFI